MTTNHFTESTDAKRPEARGIVRALLDNEAHLLRDHLLRLDRDSRHDRFNGFVDNEFIKSYAARSVAAGAVILAYVEDGMVRAAAELHQPSLMAGSEPEMAFSVESDWRRRGFGSLLFARLLEVAQRLGFRRVKITTGAQNDAMRALAHKFGAHLTFHHGETDGVIDVAALPRQQAGADDLVASWAGVGRACLKAAMSLYGAGRRKQ
jgi:GNAT superfamily N-acetyltransferase